MTAAERVMTPRILVFDIETTPMKSWHWKCYDEYIAPAQVILETKVLCFAAKWLGEELVTFGRKKGASDRAVCKQIWDLFNEAEIVVGHNCVEESTPVLKADLTWVPAGSLVEGDELVAFDEGTPPGKPCRVAGKWQGAGGVGRDMRKAVVTENAVVDKDCLTAVLSNGDEITTTADHYWLVATANSFDHRWKTTLDLRPGMKIRKYMEPWATDTSYEAGWLAGFLDGEGCVKRITGGSSLNGIQYCQRPGAVWDRAMATCAHLGVSCTHARVPKTGGLGKQDTLYTEITGGKFALLGLLGRIRPSRMLEKVNLDQLGTLKSQSAPWVTVVEVRPAGRRPVAVLSTSTKTFFAAGYPMHNCNRFDAPTMNSRWIQHGAMPPSPYKVVDTLKIAKGVGKFGINKLDYLGRYLKIGKKTEHEGFDLWLKCMANDPEAWARMELYNINDVLLTEELYLKLRPWDKRHPNIGIMHDDDSTPRCVCCGSTVIVEISKASYTAAGVYPSFRCGSCGKVMRGRSRDKRQDYTLANSL